MTRLRAWLRKLLCLLFDHNYETVDVNAHDFGCPCYPCGSHGAVTRRCKRCSNEKMSLQLIC